MYTCGLCVAHVQYVFLGRTLQCMNNGVCGCVCACGALGDLGDHFFALGRDPQGEMRGCRRTEKLSNRCCTCSPYSTRTHTLCPSI